MSIRELVEAIDGLHREEQILDSDFEYSAPLVGASEGDLLRLSAFIGEELDGQYEDFLRVCNGWPQDEAYWSYLSVDEIISCQSSVVSLRSSIEHQRNRMNTIYGVEDGGRWAFPGGEVIFDWASLLPVAVAVESPDLRMLCIGNQPRRGMVVQFWLDEIDVMGNLESVLRQDQNNLDRYLDRYR